MFHYKMDIQTWVSGCHQVSAAERHDPSWDPERHDGHIRGTCPFRICHSETMGRWVQTWQRQRWSWTKVREAIDSNNSTEQWSCLWHDHGGSPHLNLSDCQEIGHFIGTSRSHNQRRTRNVKGVCKMGLLTPDAECQKKTWQSLRLTHPISWTEFGLWMRLGFITVSLRPRSSQNNGSIRSHQPHRRSRSHPLLARSWPLFSGMRKECYWWTTSRRVILWPTVQSVYARTWRKRGREWSRNVSCFTRTMLQRIHQWLRWQPFGTVASNRVPHSPYSPDFAPSNFHLCPNRKKDLACRYTIDEEVIDAVDSYLEDQPKDFYCSGIEALRHRWKECVDSQGDYYTCRN